MKKNISLSVLILFVIPLLGQPNLIPNPSFEQYYSCPNNNQQADTCIGWHSLMFTPDYYNRCTNIIAATIPNNIGGYQDTYDGDGYMGIINFFGYYFWRELIGTTLLDTLTIGNNYNFSMRVSMGNYTGQAINITACNRMGMKLFNYIPTMLDTFDIDNSATVYSNIIISDTSNWVLLSWDFVADSNYKYIAIGNFFDDLNTDTFNFPVDTDGSYWPYGSAYYFIDSLNLKCISPICTNGSLGNLNSDELVIALNQNFVLSINSTSKSSFYVEIYNSLGQLQVTKQGTNSITIDLSKYQTGVYLVNIRDPQKSKAYKVTKF